MSGRKTVLLVDDEQVVRTLIERVLVREGYWVRGVSDAGEAQAAWESLHGAVDLLVTDLTMPGMDGRQLAELLRRRRPNLPVLFISGRLPEPGDALAEGPQPSFLVKPFDAPVLLDALRDLLDGPAP